MTFYLRIYPNDQAARDAAAKLAEAGLYDHHVVLAGNVAGQEKETVEAAVKAGTISERFTKICVRNLKAGHSLVATKAPYGRGKAALSIMESFETVDTDLLNRYGYGNPTPLSDALELPVLSKQAPATKLLRHDWTFSSIFGLGLLSEKAAPFSSMFGMKTLTTPKPEWKKSFGIPMLSNNPAPLSSMFGMTTILKPKQPWNWSFGMPLLSKDPAPLSNLFRIRILSKDQ